MISQPAEQSVAYKISTASGRSAARFESRVRKVPMLPATNGSLPKRQCPTTQRFPNATGISRQRALYFVDYRRQKRLTSASRHPLYQFARRSYPAPSHVQSTGSAHTHTMTFQFNSGIAQNRFVFRFWFA